MGDALPAVDLGTGPTATAIAASRHLLSRADLPGPARASVRRLPRRYRIFYQYTDSAGNGRRIDDYGSLSSEWEALSPVCR
jgi:hypothetical protein